MNTARCSACNMVVRLPHAKARASHARCEDCHRQAAGGRRNELRMELGRGVDFQLRALLENLKARTTMVSTPPASSPEAAWWKREVELEDAAAEREAHSYDETDAYDDRVAVSNWLTPVRVTSIESGSNLVRCDNGRTHSTQAACCSTEG